MAKTTVNFNPRYFDTILKSSGVRSLTKATADAVLARARSAAPVNTGAYREGLRVELRESRYRNVYRVVGTDRKTLLIEARTGNLARALKAVGRG